MRRCRARSIALALVALCGLAAPLPPAAEAADRRRGGYEAPYPPSELITGVRFDWATLRLLAPGSDNWPVTWAADGGLYTTWGDGGGFGQGAAERAYVSLGVGRLSGESAATLAGRNLIGGLAPAIARCFPRIEPAPADGHDFSPCHQRGIAGKARGILALGRWLHLWVTPGSTTHGYEWGRVLRARIGGNDWTAAPWHVGRDTVPPLIFPTFLQAGRDHADLPGGHAYSYAARYAPRDPRSDRLDTQFGPGGGQIYLLRSPRGNLLAPPEYNAGGDSWTGSGAGARPVFADRNGAGPRVSATYVRQLRRYILMSGHGREYTSRLGIFESENPWGPWRTVFYGTLGEGERVPKLAFFYNFLPNAFSADGGRFTFVFTGTEGLDALAVVDGGFELARSASGDR